MKRKNIVIIILIIIIFSGLLLVMNNSSDKVIENSFKYLEANDINNLKKCYSDRYQNTNFNIENIESVELIEKILITDKSEYDNYISRVNNNENIKIFKVKYELKLKNEEIGPEPSGVYEKIYYLKKESFWEKWKIDEMGY